RLARAAARRAGRKARDRGAARRDTRGRLRARAVRRGRGARVARRPWGFAPLGRREVSGILPRGGTVLGTPRTNPYKVDGGVDAVLRHFREEHFDALVAIGGEDTLGVAARLHREHAFPGPGGPQTLAHDLSGTDYPFGFDTAVTIATEAIDR